MACVLTLNISKFDGTLTTVTFDNLPSDLANSPDSLFKYLLEKQFIYQELLEALLIAVNESKFPMASISLEDISGDTVCNYNLDLIRKSFIDKNDLYTKGLYGKVQEFGINLNDFNILVTKSPNGARRVYKNAAGRHIVVMPNNVVALQQYLKYRIVKAAFNKNDSGVTNSLNAILADLKEIFQKRKGLSAKYPLLSQAIANNDIETILELYYNDGRSYVIIDKANSIDLLKEAEHSMLNFNELQIAALTNDAVKEFIEVLKASDNKTKYEIDALVKLASKYLLRDKDKKLLKDPRQIILYINRNIVGNNYYDIKFVGKDYILFRTVPYKPEFTRPSLNDKYFGEQVKPLYNKGGYNIVQVGENYYVTKLLPGIAENLGTVYVTFGSAMKVLNTRIERETLLFNSTELKLLRSLKGETSGVYETKASLPTTFNIILKNIKLPDEVLNKNWDYTAYFDLTTDQNNKILIGKSLTEIHKILLTEKYWKNIVTPEQVQLLDTLWKCELFLILKQAKEVDLKEQAKKNKKPLKPISSAAITKIFETISTAKDTLFTATIQDVENKSNALVFTINKYTGEKVQLYVPQPRLLKTDLYAIGETLLERFGIKINMVSTYEIANTPAFAGIKSYARAFILNGEVYVNVDKAYSSDLIHEFGHLIFGTIKQTNPELYDKFINFIDSLRSINYTPFEKYEASKLSRTDINEEVLVDLFGHIMANKIKENVGKLSTQDLNAMKKAYLNAVENVFGSGKLEVGLYSSSITKLLNETIQEFKEEYGADNISGFFSELLQEDSTITLNAENSYESRKIARVITLLLDKKTLIENCE